MQTESRKRRGKVESRKQKAQQQKLRAESRKQKGESGKDRKPTHGLKHVGVALMAVAISRSVKAGAGGRIWLESLPGAASFYENLGLTQHPRRSAEGNVIYVLEPGTAEQLLAEIKAQDIIAA